MLSVDENLIYLKYVVSVKDYFYGEEFWKLMWLN
jgi:hypothetical protein